MRPFTLLLALCALVAACSSSSEPITPLPFDASVQPLMVGTSTTSGRGTGQSVTATVTLFNPDSRPRIIHLRDICAATLRVYTSSSLSGTPAWNSESLPGGCKSLTSPPDTVQPRDSIHVIAGPFHYSEMTTTDPSTLIPPGHYYFGVYLLSPQLVNGSAVVPAGEGDLGLTLR